MSYNDGSWYHYVNSMDEIELKLLKELGPEAIELSKKAEELSYARFGSVMRYNDFAGVIIYKDAIQTIIRNRSGYVIFEMYTTADVGSFVIFRADYITILDKDITNLPEELLDYTKLFDSPENITGQKEYLITKEDYLAMRENKIAEEKKEEETRRLEAEARKKEEESKPDPEVVWKTQSIYEPESQWSYRLSAHGDIIDWQGDTYKLDRNVNEVYPTLGQFRALSDKYMQLTGKVNELISKPIDSLTITRTEGAQTYTLDIKLKNGECTMNGVQVRKDKIGMIVNNLKKYTDEEIGILNKMNVTKMNFLNISSFRINENDCDIPVVIEAVGNNHFAISLNVYSTTLNFDLIKDLLNITPYYASAQHSISYERFRRFCTEHMGMTKAQIFDAIREAKLLKDI